MMGDAHVCVRSFDDITDQVPSRESETVARALNTGVEYVLVTEEWIAQEKDLDAIDGERRVFVGERERATEKAWLFSTGQTAAWVPKSQSVLCSAGTTEPIETLQRDLTEFERKQNVEVQQS